MKSVLILVMSAQQPPWGEMIETSMKTWDSIEQPHVGTIFYCGNPVGLNTHRVIYFPYDSLLHELGRLTLCAYAHALTLDGWDYIARVNSSCYVHKRNLLEYVQTKPDRDVLCGLIADSGVGFKYLWGGGQFILSRDVVQKIVENASAWNHQLMEDVAVTKLALDIGIPLDGNGRCCSIDNDLGGGNFLMCYNGKPGCSFSDWSDINKADDQFFYRVKNDADRSVDRERMLLLFKHLRP